MYKKNLNIYNIKRINLNIKDSSNKNIILNKIFDLLKNINYYLTITDLDKKNHISISFGKLEKTNWSACFYEKNNLIKIDTIFRDSLLNSLENIFYHEYGHFIYYYFLECDYCNNYNIDKLMDILLNSLYYSETISKIKNKIFNRMSILKGDYWSMITDEEKYLLEKKEIFARFFSSFMLYHTTEDIENLDFTKQEIKKNEFILLSIFDNINQNISNNNQILII